MGVQRYENMNTAHGAGWGKWVYGIAISATPYLVKYGPGGVTFLTHIHSNRCKYLCWDYPSYFIY